MATIKYISREWAEEAYKRLREQLTPEMMKFVTTSMLNVFTNCPDGKDHSFYFKYVDGLLQEVTMCDDNPPEAEFVVIGDYETYLRISKAEIGARVALMSGRLRLKRGNLAKALNLVTLADRLNKIISEIPCDYS